MKGGMRASEVQLDWLLPQLEGVEGANGSFQAWCPCHDDIGTSLKGLSIAQKNGRVLCKCHSCGATLVDVIKTLEGDARERSNGTAPIATINKHTNGKDGMVWWCAKTGVPREIWERLDCRPHGTGVAFHFDEDLYKVRLPPKEFGWHGTETAEAPPLWPPVPDKCPAHITLVEGESDCGTAHAAGLPYAFATTKGAKSALPTGTFRALRERGVTQITVCGDTDDPGQEFASRVSREALAAGLSVDVIRLETILDPFAGITDLNGTYRAAETTAQFLELITRATQPLASRIRVYTLEEMVQFAKEEVDWLIPDLFAPGDKVLLAAPQKSLKSWLALELTRCLTTGGMFLKRPEWESSKPRRVFYIQEEGSRTLWARRMECLRVDTSNPYFSFSHRTGFNFMDPSYTDEILSICRDTGVDFLILDPLQRMTPGIEENDASSIGIIYDEVFRLQQALPHLAVMLVHHANKQARLSWESVRGSSRHAGEVDVGLFLERHPLEHDSLRMWLDGRDIPQYLGTGESFEVKVKIDRDERLFEMDATEIIVDVSTSSMKGRANKEVVLDAIAGGAQTRAQVCSATDLSDNTATNHISALVVEGLIIEHDHGKGHAHTYTAREE